MVIFSLLYGCKSCTKGTSKTEEILHAIFHSILGICWQDHVSNLEIWYHGVHQQVVPDYQSQMIWVGHIIRMLLYVVAICLASCFVVKSAPSVLESVLPNWNCRAISVHRWTAQQVSLFYYSIFIYFIYFVVIYCYLFIIFYLLTIKTAAKKGNEVIKFEHFIFYSISVSKRDLSFQMSTL